MCAQSTPAKRSRVQVLRRFSEHVDVIDWPCIEGFVGYGRADAPVVFIGPAGLTAELRSTYNKYMGRLSTVRAYSGGIKGANLSVYQVTE